MNAVWWILIGAVVAPIAWFVLKAVVGLTVPPEVTGKHLLKQELRHCGVDPDKLPEACLRDLTEHAVTTARCISDIGGEALTYEVVRNIEATALLVLNDLRGASEFEGSWTKDILRKHGVLS